MPNKFLKTTWAYIALLILIPIPLCLSLFGGDLIHTHDSMAGLIRALSMSQYMGHGQFLVRWAPAINWGYGYPMFNFYPPFFSFVSVLIFQLTQNMALAINWACILFWILSGIGMFLLAREFWGPEGGMLSAILYIYAPYHIVDLYVRGAFAEFSSFAFFPFLILAILKISRGQCLGYIFLGVISVFGLSLTHNIMSMLFFPIAFIYMFYLYFTENKSSWIFTAIGVFVIGMMMSSFFWLPALWEKKFLNLNFLLSIQYDYHQGFISLKNLFWPINIGNYNNITLQVGIVHTVLSLIALVFIRPIFRINRSLGLGYIFFLGVTLIAAYFTLPDSYLFWKNIKLLDFVQFPWRFLGIIIFAMSFTAGAVALLIKNPKVKIILLITVGLTAILLYSQSIPKLSYISNDQKIEDFLAMGEGEYTPKWVLRPPDRAPDQKFDIVQGKGQLSEEKSINPVQYTAKYQAIEPSLVCFNTFYFPGWQVYLDGQAVQPYLDNPYGVILFYVPTGSHDIKVVFGSTMVRTVAMIISCVGFILLIGMILWFYGKIKKC